MFKKFKISFRTFNVSLLCGLLCAVFMSLASFDASCEDLRTNVLRLHIIANSDSAADQNLKLKIRDQILAESGNLFDGITDTDEAVLRAEQNLALYRDIADRVIAENGFSYKSEVFLGESYFETRVYDDFTLPAGYYKSLIVKVGEAKGKNWWCVIFPQMCIPAAKADLSLTVEEKSKEIAEQQNRYIMRFKIVEIYEKIKKSIIL